MTRGRAPWGVCPEGANTALGCRPFALAPRLPSAVGGYGKTHSPSRRAQLIQWTDILVDQGHRPRLSYLDVGQRRLGDAEHPEGAPQPEECRAGRW